MRSELSTSIVLFFSCGKSLPFEVKEYLLLADNIVDSNSL